MTAEASTELPSQVTGPYWVFAHAPGKRTPGAGRAGKWLVFVPAEQVDSWWQKVRTATEDGSLGCKAKVATARLNPRQASPGKKPICVYTRDWQDGNDVLRVLGGLRDLGISWRLAYKTGQATSAGTYGRGSSAYVSPPGSRDFQDSAPPDQRLS